MTGVSIFGCFEWGNLARIAAQYRAGLSLPHIRCTRSSAFPEAENLA
jgi:hypothetical protein